MTRHQIRVEINPEQDCFEVTCTCGFIERWMLWWSARQAALIHSHTQDGNLPGFVLIKSLDFAIEEMP